MSPGAKKALIVLVVIICVPVVGMVVAAVQVNRSVDAWANKSEFARKDLLALGKCLDAYRSSTGRYPTTEEGLRTVLAAGGRCEAGLRDPWGRDYFYEYPGRLHPDRFDLYTLGADGQPGGEGENADLLNP